MAIRLIITITTAPRKAFEPAQLYKTRCPKRRIVMAGDYTLEFVSEHLFERPLSNQSVQICG